MSRPDYSLGKLTRTRTDGSRYWSWCITYTNAVGSRSRVSLNTTSREVAVERAAAYWQQATSVTAETIGEIVEAVLAPLPEPFHGWDNPRTDAALRTRIRDAEKKRFMWRKCAAFWQDMRPEDVTLETSDRFLVWRKRKLGTMRTDLIQLRSLLNKGKAAGLTPVAVPIRVPALPDSKTPHVSKDEFRTWLAGCIMPHVKLFAILAVTTSARRSALLCLRWEQVDLDKRLVYLNPDDREANSKGRATLPLNDRATEALREALPMRSCEWVIEYRSGPVASVKTGFRLTSERTGVHLHPHMLRHSAAVWMAEDRVPMEEIMRFLGHTNIATTIRIYARFHPDYMRGAAKSLEF